MKRAEKSYVIFGIGKFGRSVAEELTAAGMHVLAIDKDEDKVDRCGGHRHHGGHRRRD